MILLLVVLAGGYYGAREVALRIADHLTITVTPVAPSHQTPIYRQVFGPAIAADAQRLLNDDASPLAQSRLQDLGDNLTSYTGPIWQYHLAFTWHGVVIETADTLYDGTPEFFTVSVLGLPELSKRSAVSASATDRHPILTSLVHDSGGAIPAPPA